MGFKMDFLEMIQRGINRLFSRFKIFSIRSNLLIIFGVYSVCLFVTLIVYGYLNMANVVSYRKDSEITAVSRKLGDFASAIVSGDDIRSVQIKLQKSDMIDDGAFVFIDREGNAIFSTFKDEKTNKPLNITREFLSRLTKTSGVLSKSSEFGNYYVFYYTLKEKNLILLYVVPKDTIESYNFSAANFIVYSSIMCVLIFIGMLLIFKFKVYAPIVNVEKVIHGVIEGDTDLKINNVSKDSQLHSLYSDLNVMIDRLKDLILREYTANIMKKQAELDALQSQINPHFLYNTLESIRGQAITLGMEDIEIMTKALSDLFRYSISKKGNLVTFEEELKNVDNYLMIQQYRFNNKFIIVNNVDADTLHYKIPKLLIQPIVENAIHHGLETKLGKGTITIKAYKTAKRLVVTIQDDGLGISHDRLVEINEVLVKGQADIETKQSGLRIGLINVNERIKLNFGDDYGLRVYSAKGIGTTVEIVLPLIND